MGAASTVQRLYILFFLPFFVIAGDVNSVIAGPVEDVAIRFLDYTYRMEVGSLAIILRLTASGVSGFEGCEETFKVVTEKIELGAHALTQGYYPLKEVFAATACPQGVTEDYEKGIKEYKALTIKERRKLQLPEAGSERVQMLGCTLDKYAELLTGATECIYNRFAEILSQFTPESVIKSYDVSKSYDLARRRIAFEEARSLRSAICKLQNEFGEWLESDTSSMRPLTDSRNSPVAIEYLWQTAEAEDVFNTISLLFQHGKLIEDCPCKTATEMLAAIDVLIGHFEDKEYPEVNNFKVKILDDCEFDTGIIVLMTSEELKKIMSKVAVYMHKNGKPAKA